MRRRRAALHFGVLGALLFALTSAFDAIAIGERPGSTGIERDDPSPDELLHRAALALGLDRDDPVIARRLIQNMQFVAPDLASEEAHGEALALGLTETDLVVRRRLIERMRRLLEQPGLAAEPTSAELQAYLDAHADRFTTPARVWLTQIRLGPATAALPVPSTLVSASEQDLGRWLGPGFAGAVVDLPAGGWHGPIASPYGLHLVWIHERRPAERQPLQDVRGAVRAALREERAAAAMQEGLKRTRRAQQRAETSLRRLREPRRALGTF